VKKTVNGVEYELAPGGNLRGADLRGANLREADLSGANLREADLRGTNLSGADLCEADLSGADLRGANLRGADLSGANLRGANLSEADLSGADLCEADLSGANLLWADLRGANLSEADLRDTKLPAFQVPQTGDMTVFKKLAAEHIATLLIPAEAKRTASLVGRKCRAEFVDVIAIEDKEGAPVEEMHSNRTEECVYRVGERAHPDSYDDDPRVECTNGVHFFLTREEAEAW
jgi:hypothetical protein